MSQIIPFQFESHDVRTLTHDDGSIWWVLADVCAVLGLSNPREVAKRLDASYLSTVSFSDGPLGGPDRHIVNEPGLYQVIFRSNKPEAEKFQHWVFEEVLPQIRKTGKYEAPVALPARPTVADRITEVRLVAEFLEELGQLTSRDKLMFADMIRTELVRSLTPPSNAPLALPAPEHFDIAERIKHLNYRLPRKDERRLKGLVGREVAKEYRLRHKREPEKSSRYVDGAVRDVGWYTLDDAPWIDAVIQVALAKEGLTRAEKETTN